MVLRPQVIADADSIYALYEHALCGYIDTTDDDLIVRVNQTLLQWTGYNPEQLRNLTFRELLTPGGQIFFETHLAPLLAVHGGVNEIALELALGSGRVLPVLVNIVRLTDGTSGSVWQRVLLFRATDRASYEHELLLARREAEDATAAHAALLAVLNHDIRSPLHVIAGVADLLASSALTTEQRRCVEALTSSAQRIVELITGISAAHNAKSCS